MAGQRFAIRQVREGKTTATFTIDGYSQKSSIMADVLDEDRKIEVKDGKLTDDFDAYAVHLYRISP